MSVRLQLWLLVFFFSALGLIAYASSTPRSVQETSAPVVQEVQSRTGNLQPDLALYARGSEDVLRRFPVAPPYAQFILYSEYWQQYRIVERGDRAILFYTSTPLVSPHLFRHSSAGLQLDLASEVFETRERIGGAFTWEMLRGGEYFAHSKTYSPGTMVFYARKTAITGACKCVVA